MSQSFGELAIKQAGEFDDPDKPRERHTFDRPRRLAYCIDLLLETAEDYPALADLPRRLTKSARLLAEDFAREGARRAVRDLAEGFENYLQLIAATKYSHREEVLFGEEGIHVGFFSTSLGGLLHGTPDKVRTPSQLETEVPNLRIVTYEPNSGQRRDRMYKKTNQIRNQVHEARKPEPLRLLQEAKIVFAAYLFATEENDRAIANQLYEYIEYLRTLRADLQDRLHFVVDPQLAEKLKDPDGPQSRSASESVSVERQSWGLDDLTEQVIDQGAPRLAIYGDPGSGKTTVVRALACRIAQEKRQNPLGNTPVPIVVEASRYTADKSFTSLVAAQVGADPSALESFTGMNRLLICIDGINEIQARYLQSAIADIQNLSTRMPEAAFLVTSRFERLFRALGFRNFEILPFDNDRISDFLHNTFATDEKATRLLRELNQRPRLLSLCRNPLLLYMLTDISAERVRIPRNRGKLLHEFMNRFLDREAPQIAPVRPSTVRLLLSQLAFAMRKRRVVSLPAVEVEQQVRDELRDLQAGIGASDLLSAVRGAKLLHDVGDDRIAFFHELIQEYFAALELLRRFRSGDLNIADYASSRWWQEVLILAYGLSEDDEGLYTALEESNLALVAKGVMDGPAPDPNRQADVVSRATAVLDQDTTGQPEALEALATVWNKDALRRVARALDSSKEVIDFVERFTDEPYQAVIDLIEVSPSPVVFSGATAALHRTSSQGTPGQRRRLFNVCCKMLTEKADGSWPQLNYEQFVSLSLLGEVGEAQRRLAQKTVHTLIDIEHLQKAAKFASRFHLTGTDPSLDYRLLRALIIAHLPPANIDFTAEHVLDDADRRTLLGLATLEGQYRWLTLLLDDEGRHSWLRAIRPSIVDHLLRSKDGRKAGDILQKIWEGEFAQTYLETRLARVEIEPENVSSVVSWLGAGDVFRQHLTDYVFLARRRRCAPQHFSRLAQWAEPGDLDPDLGTDIGGFLLEEGHVGPGLYMIYAAGISEEFSDAIRSAEAHLEPEKCDPSRRHWQDLVCGKCWHWWSPGFQTKVLEHFLHNDTDPIADTWCQEARDTLARTLEERFLELDPSVRPEICRIAGVFAEAQTEIKKAIPNALAAGEIRRAFNAMMSWNLSAMDLPLSAEAQDRWREAALRHGEELAQDGRVQEAIGLLERWDIQPQQIDSDIFELRSGKSPSKVVCAGYDEGIFNLPEVEGWFLHQLRSGNISEALSVNRSRQLANELSGPAILAVLEMFEDERYKEAGQVIAGFDLQAEFGPELDDLIPHLISAGKPGVAHQLSQNLSSEHTAAMGQLVVDASIDQIEAGHVGSAIGLIRDAGVSFIRREFEQRLVELLISYRDSGKRTQLQMILSDRRIWPFLPEDEDFIISLLEFSDAAVPATAVRIMDEKGYGFASFPSSEITVFFHANELQGDFASVEKGSDLLVRVADHSRGPRATWSTLVTAPDEKSSPHAEERPMQRNKGDAVPDLEKLKESWGARLRTDK